jgi:hypothetical protein
LLLPSLQRIVLGDLTPLKRRVPDPARLKKLPASG